MKEFKNFFLRNLKTPGPLNSFPFGVNRFFNNMLLLYLNFKKQPSSLAVSFLVLMIILFNLDFFLTQLLGFVNLTLIFTKSPILDALRLKPPYK